jgi:hypothetical protein
VTEQRIRQFLIENNPYSDLPWLVWRCAGPTSRRLYASFGLPIVYWPYLLDQFRATVELAPQRRLERNFGKAMDRLHGRDR